MTPLLLSGHELRVLAGLTGGVCPPVCAGDLDPDDVALGDLVALRGLLARRLVAVGEDESVVLDPSLAPAVEAMEAARTVVEIECWGPTVRRWAVVARDDEAVLFEEVDADVWGLSPVRFDADLLVAVTGLTDGDSHPDGPLVVTATIPADADAEATERILDDRVDEAVRILRRAGLGPDEAEQWARCRTGATEWRVGVGHVEDDGRVSGGLLRWLVGPHGLVLLGDEEDGAGTDVVRPTPADVDEVAGRLADLVPVGSVG